MQDIQRKNRGILFNSDMVKALLAGIKTQTRRTSGLKALNTNPDKWVIKDSYLDQRGRLIYEFISLAPNGNQNPIKIACPYGAPADELWVRETIYFSLADNAWRYLADNTDISEAVAINSSKRIVPSIHMPRAAGRLNLQITHIGVERLNDIAPADAIAEGIDIFKKTDFNRYSYYKTPVPKDVPFIHSQPSNPVTAFVNYVRAINKLSSDFNPWVWVVNFEVLDNPSDFWVECNVCKQRYKNWVGSTACCGSIAYMVEADGKASTKINLFASIGGAPIKPVEIDLKNKNE